MNASAKALAAVPTLMIGLLLAWSVNAESQQYLIDPEHTHIPWEVDRFGFARTMGSFTQVTGSISLDPDDLSASTVDAQISLAGLRSDLPQREDIIRGEYWLKAAEYPVITFTSTQVTAGGDIQQPFTVLGDMTLAGVTRPLTLKVTLNKIGTDPVTRQPAIGLSAAGDFKRSDFGIKTALGPVGDQVSFRIESMAVTAATE